MLVLDAVALRRFRRHLIKLRMHLVLLNVFHLNRTESAQTHVQEGLLAAEVEAVVEEGLRLLRFEYQGNFMEILDQLGTMGLGSHPAG